MTRMKRRCPNWSVRLIWLWGCLICLGVMAQATAAFKVLEAQAQLEAGVHQLTAKIEYGLSPAVEEALLNGIPLTLKLSIKILSPRRFLWPKTVHYQSQAYLLSYHALTRRYVIHYQNTGLQQTFRELSTALQTLGDIKALPLIPQTALKPTQTYQGALQVKLHLSALPPLLQPRAYLSDDWHLESEWFQWTLNP